MAYQLEHHAPSSKVIYIDSRDATNYLTFENSIPMTSHFQFIFDDVILIPDNISTLVSLHSASIPYSFYNIREGINDRLDFEIALHANYPTGFVRFFIDIPEGNYSVNSLLYRLSLDLETALINLNADASSPLYNIIPNPKFLFEYVKWKQKVVLSWATDSTKGFEIRFLFETGDNRTRAMRVELGFREGDTQGFYFTLAGEQRASLATNESGISKPQDSQFQTKFMSPNCIDIQNSVRGLYIRTNLTTTSTLDTQSGSYSSILARVPITIQSGGVVFFTPNQGTHKALIKLNIIKAITIRITDERNRLINFNGLNLQIALQLDFVYTKKPIASLTALESRMLRHTDERNENNNRPQFLKNKKVNPK
tara:strand:- start:5597 stop:6697 length:1101 start_codon:yes stop_codon:yes gene_type:complete